MIYEQTENTPIPDLSSYTGKSYKLTTLGKLFFASLLSSMTTGKKSPFNVTGDKNKIDLLMKVVQSTKKFQDEIKNPAASIDSVIRAMDMKNIDANNFEQIFLFPWPL
jgi:hypothetical protein